MNAPVPVPATDPVPEVQRQPAVVDRSEPRLDLRATLPYLLGRAGTGLADAFNAEMRQYGINLQVWRILASLLWRDRQRITELALNTSIEVSTVSRLVAANVRGGLLTRQRAGDDAPACISHRHDRDGELPTPPELQFHLHAWPDRPVAPCAGAIHARSAHKREWIYGSQSAFAC